MSAPEMEDVPMKFKLPLHHRVYFFVRMLLVRFLRGAISICSKLHWPWAVFQLMSLQRRLGLRFEQ